jgi:cytochrome c biogenesis protein CcmG/thiol:disulfide interchange protein DsbE
MAKRSKVYPVQIPPLPLHPGRAGMSRRARRQLSFVLAGLILAIAAGAVLLAVFPPGKEALLPVGAPAPGFTLRTSAGATVSLQRLRGQPVLLEFCATWSSQCALEAPLLNGLVSRTSFLVSINGDSEDAASVASFTRTYRLRFPILLDPGEKTVSFPTRGPRGLVTGRYRVTRFPTFYVLDAAGRVTWRDVGAVPPTVLAGEIRRAARPVP